MIRMIPSQALAALLFSLIALAQPANPGKDWERRKPEEVDYSSKRLDALNGYLATIDTTARMAVHKGKVIFEYGDVTRQGMLTSVQKSLLAILYGKYVANGKINLETTLEELGIDDVEGLLPVEKRAKVRHLITMQSGVFHKNSYPAGGTAFPKLHHAARSSLEAIFSTTTGASTSRAMSLKNRPDSTSSMCCKRTSPSR